MSIHPSIRLSFCVVYVANIFLVAKKYLLKFCGWIGNSYMQIAIEIDRSRLKNAPSVHHKIKKSWFLFLVTYKP